MMVSPQVVFLDRAMITPTSAAIARTPLTPTAGQKYRLTILPCFFESSSFATISAATSLTEGSSEVARESHFLVSLDCPLSAAIIPALRAHLAHPLSAAEVKMDIALLLSTAISGSQPFVNQVSGESKIHSRQNTSLKSVPSWNNGSDTVGLRLAASSRYLTASLPDFGQPRPDFSSWPY